MCAYEILFPHSVSVVVVLLSCNLSLCVCVWRWFIFIFYTLSSVQNSVCAPSLCLHVMRIESRVKNLVRALDVLVHRVFMSRMFPVFLKSFSPFVPQFDIPFIFTPIILFSPPYSPCRLLLLLSSASIVSFSPVLDSHVAAASVFACFSFVFPLLLEHHMFACSHVYIWMSLIVLLFLNFQFVSFLPSSYCIFFKLITDGFFHLYLFSFSFSLHPHMIVAPGNTGFSICILQRHTDCFSLFVPQSCGRHTHTIVIKTVHQENEFDWMSSAFFESRIFAFVFWLS